MGIELLTDEDKQTLDAAFSAGALTEEQIQTLQRKGYKFKPGEADKALLKGSQDRGREFGQMLLEESPVLVGGGIGALGGPLGAAFGAAGGEGVKQTLQHLNLFPGEAPTTSTEAAGEILKEGAMGGVGEVVAKPFQMAAGKLMAPFKGNVTDEGKLALKALEDTDLVIPPAKVTDSRILDISENAAEASLIGGEGLLQNAKNIADFSDNAIQSTVESMLKSGSVEDLGVMVQQSVNDQSMAFRGVANALYKRVDELSGMGPRQGIGISPLKEMAEELMVEVKSGVKTAGSLSVLRQVLSKPEAMSFKELQILRSDLLQITRQGNDVLSGRTQRIAGKLANVIDNLMENTAKDIGGETLEAWRSANEFWKQGQGTFNNGLIKAITNADPSMVSRLIANGTTAKPEAVRRIFAAVGDPEVIKEIQGGVMQDVLFRSIDSSGEVSAKQLLGRLKKIGGVDDSALTALFPKGEHNTLRKFANVKNLSIQGQPDATGRMVVQFGQAGAAGALVFGLDVTGTSLAILLGPAALAKMFTNKTVAKWLTTGFKPGKKVKVTTGSFGQFLQILAREKIPYELPEGEKTPFGGVVKKNKGPLSKLVPQEESTQPSSNVLGVDALTNALLGGN